MYWPKPWRLGIPVVGTNVGGVAELVDSGVNGFRRAGA